MALNNTTQFLSAFAMVAGATLMTTNPAVAQFGRVRGTGNNTQTQAQMPSRNAGRPYYNENEIRGPKVVYNIQEAHFRIDRATGIYTVDLDAIGQDTDPLSNHTAVHLHAVSDRNGKAGNLRHSPALYVKQAETSATPTGDGGYIATNLNLNLAEFSYNQDKATFLYQKFGTQDNNEVVTLRTIQFVGNNVKTIVEDQNRQPIVYPQNALDALTSDALNGLLLGAGDITDRPLLNPQANWKQKPVEINVNAIGSGFKLQP